MFGGLGDTAHQLQNWLLAKCASNPDGLYVAHNLHWFLAAHVLPAPDVPGRESEDPAATDEKFAKVSE